MTLWRRAGMVLWIVVGQVGFWVYFRLRFGPHWPTPEHGGRAVRRRPLARFLGAPLRKLLP